MRNHEAGGVRLIVQANNYAGTEYERARFEQPEQPESGKA